MTLLRAAAFFAGDSAGPKPAFHVVVILSDQVAKAFLAGDKSSGAVQAQAFISGKDEGTLNLPLTPGARFAMESIRRCPFVGASRGMALTARCHDLLFEFLHALSTTQAPRHGVVIRTAEEEQIRSAAQQLEATLHKTPTLAALARTVGLSETKLKRGFHQVFGDTVFGYLRERRMARARALLEEGNVTVLEAAEQVGYSNPSNFAAAFREQFGVNPKEFQLTVRRRNSAGLG